VQNVRRRIAWALRVKRGTLADTEAMLLVDDADSEPSEGDVRLDQGMGTDDQAKLAAAQTRQRLAPAGGAGCAGEQGERDRLVAK
jgi:hypothetical protein